MRNILARANRDVLDAFACANVLLAFDYDGTLAPIVADPVKAEMRRSTRELLCSLVRLYPVVVISGRAQADVLDMVHGTGVHAVVGNHGIEPRDASVRHMRDVRRWMPILAKRVGALDGVAIEDKVYSLAVHYRRSREKKRALRAILQAVAALGDVRVIRGKQVVNVLPHDAPHKGIALERERERFRCDTAIYVGDDETDEDVFMLDQPGRLLSIRVGAKRTSAAHYHIAGQRSIDALLRALIEQHHDANASAEPRTHESSRAHARKRAV